VITSLQEAALCTLAEYQIDDLSDFKAAQSRIEQSSLETFIRASLMEPLDMLKLSARRLALPIAATSPRIIALSCGQLRHFATCSSLPGAATVVEAEITFEAEIGFQLQTSSGPDELEESKTSTVTKDVNAKALVTIDAFGRPINGELSSIAALDDDAGRRAWDALDRVRNTFAHFRGIFEPSTLEAIRKASQVGASPAMLDAIRRASQFKASPAIIDAIRRTNQLNASPAMLDAIRTASQFKPSPAIIDAIGKRIGLKFHQRHGKRS
jgi:hypothetical protein